MLSPCKRGHAGERDKNGRCRECQRETYRKWYAANKDTVYRKWYEANREKKRGQARRWREANPDKVQEQNARKRAAIVLNPEKRDAYFRRYREANREKIAEGERLRYERNREKRGEQCRRWAKANPDKQRRYYLKYRYGLTPDEYGRLLAAQGQKCAICSRSGKLHVDHDHATGAVRGLLCQGCNSGLGGFADNVEALRIAIKYVAWHSVANRFPRAEPWLEEVVGGKASGRRP